MRRRSTLSAALAVVLGASVLVPALPALADDAALPAVRINEVVSNGDTFDWIEVVNIGAEPVDISGWIVKDDNDSRTLAVASDTTLEPGAFFAIDVNNNATPGNFGLGNGDQARIFLPDGTTLVDGMSYAAHARLTGGEDTSWARCPDGTGDFLISSTTTKGAANDCPRPQDAVRINEVVTSGGVPGDWIEIVNIGQVSVDVSGWVVKDDVDTRTLSFPENTLVAPGEFATIDVDVTGGFGLGSADSARLYLPGGSVLVDEYSWTAHGAPSWGRCPDGFGDFRQTAGVTKGTANECVPPAGASVRINEVESNQGTPGDWVELLNTGDQAVDASGWFVMDDQVRAAQLPQGTVIEPGAFYVIEEALMGFGLGANDMVRIFDTDGLTLIDQFSWTGHAATTYGRCPDGTGEFQVTTASTKGAPNDCSFAVRINEIVTQGDDWIELVNAGPSSVDLGGYVVSDNQDSNTAVIPAETVLGPGDYFVVEAPLLSFGLGSADSARLFAPDGIELIDEYTWASHPGTSWARCPDATGEFQRSVETTKGAANFCEGDVRPDPWTGSGDVSEISLGAFGGDMSGLAWDNGALWAVRNGGPGSLFRFVEVNGTWQRDADGGFSDGRALRYPDGTGDVDAEGVAVTAGGAAAGIYVASERNNAVGSVSRPSVLRYIVSGSGPLSAVAEWNLVDKLPTVGGNAGLEGIAWVPDAALVAQGFVDGATGELYDPRTYGPHAGGVFFVALEGTGTIYGFILDHVSGGATLVATIDPLVPLVAELEWDPSTNTMWAICDDACTGQNALLTIAQSGNERGAFQVSRILERPSGMPNIANEGFALAGAETCAAGSKRAFWADDSETGGVALREGVVDCVPLPSPVDPALLTDASRGGVTAPSQVLPGEIIIVSAGATAAGSAVTAFMLSTPQLLGTATVNETGQIRLLVPSDLPDGEHRIVLQDADGTLLGWAPVQVGDTADGGTEPPRGGVDGAEDGAVRDALERTGVDAMPMALAALVMALAGLGALGVSQRRRREPFLDTPSA